MIASRQTGYASALLSSNDPIHPFIEIYGHAEKNAIYHNAYEAFHANMAYLEHG